MKIGLAQMNTQDKKQDNLAMAGKLIVELADKGAQLIMLPEYFNFLGPDELKAWKCRTAGRDPNAWRRFSAKPAN